MALGIRVNAQHDKCAEQRSGVWKTRHPATLDARQLVILDSCHHSRHVLRELELYAPLVSKGSYLIVQDTIIDQKQEWIDRYAQCIGYRSEAGPAKAVADFLRKHHMEFEVDASRERYLLTFCPGGFLKRKNIM